MSGWLLRAVSHRAGLDPESAAPEKKIQNWFNPLTAGAAYIRVFIYY